jgi:hypothetical protein
MQAMIYHQIILQSDHNKGALSEPIIAFSYLGVVDVGMNTLLCAPRYFSPRKHQQPNLRELQMLKDL